MRVIEHNPDSGFRRFFTVLPCPFTAFFHRLLQGRARTPCVPPLSTFNSQPTTVYQRTMPPPATGKRSNRKWLRPPTPPFSHIAAKKQAHRPDSILKLFSSLFRDKKPFIRICFAWKKRD